MTGREREREREREHDKSKRERITLLLHPFVAVTPPSSNSRRSSCGQISKIHLQISSTHSSPNTKVPYIHPNPNTITIEFHQNSYHRKTSCLLKAPFTDRTQTPSQAPSSSCLGFVLCPLVWSPSAPLLSDWWARNGRV
jgi:hypothetical protein